MAVKTGCRFVCEPLNEPINHPYEIDSQHPSLYGAMEDLMLYERWVSRVVLPIAFRWIAEHEDEVYGQIPENGLRDDIGIVIAAAFEAVTVANRLNPKGGDGVTSRPHNPSWVKIAKQLRKDKYNAFTSEPELLKEMVCLS